MIALAGCGETAHADADADASTPASYDADAFARAFAEAGFEVREGRFAFADLATCCASGNCWGNNPSSPYGEYLLPPGPGQSAANPGAASDGTSAAWRLREDEVVVFVGALAPGAAYQSFRSYVFDRADGTKRRALFASLGDSENSLTIAQGGAPPAARRAVVVTTAHAGALARVEAALAAAGVSEAEVRVDAIPSARVRLGLEPDADTFVELVRVAAFDDAAARDAYLAAPDARVLRLTPVTKLAPEPLAEPALRARGTGTDESALAASLDALEAAIRAREATRHPTSAIVPVPVGTLARYGFDCLASGASCLGDNRDALYLTSAPIALGASVDDVTVVFGVNHATTGKATYSNFAVYDLSKALGVAAIESREMAGSARDYLADDPNVDRLYAFRVARSCATGDAHCVEIAAGCPGVPLTASAILAFRAYLEPTTATAPLASELLADRVLHLVAP